MTRLAHWVEPGSTISEAKALMEEHGVRHLPVMEAGKIAGMLTLSDVYIIESMLAVDPDKFLVESAMSLDAFVVDADAPLAEVARGMSERHIGSAIVQRADRVEGIFTASDGLRALGEILDNAR
ncbi:MAG: CBS domain-containing protein [Deltaproteobacteria bacterium]|nr:CBS domain-containing protein [Deltaproteobacteria bacterium]